MTTTRRVLVIVGNPKAASRTRQVAERIGGLVGSSLSGHGHDVLVDTIEVCELGPDLLGWGSARAQAAVERMISADVLIVASPVYKGTYTGLLKLLFDQVAAGALARSVAVPVMVGGAAAHALAVEAHLRPLLIEVGAACPTAGVFILESELGELDSRLAAWGDVGLPRILALVAAPPATTTTDP
jgi:FMN reductase